MSPNDVKAIKLCAQIMEKPERGYNPIKNEHQAEELREKLALEIKRPLLHRAAHPTERQNMLWEVSHDGKVIETYSGLFTESKAIVYAACSLRNPKWRDKPLFGINLRFDSSEYEDAAGPEQQ